MRSRTGCYYVDELKLGNQYSPFAGLPLHVIEQIGDDPVAGTGGILYYFDHFLCYEGPTAEGAAAGITLSGVTGTATVTLGATTNGTIVLTADATANCDPCLRWGGGTPFVYTVGKRMWFSTRLKLADANLMEAFVGLGTGDTQPTVTNTLPADGIFFEKAETATAFDFHARKDATSTEKTLCTGTIADDTYTTLGFYVDVAGNILPFQDGALITAAVIAAGTANIPVAGDVMVPMIALRYASKTITIDWILFGQDI